MASWPIYDGVVQRGVGGTLERSERQEDLGQLEATFVDPGIIARLANQNNEIIYGRRGTGKTHVLKVFSRQEAAVPGSLAIYIDMRLLGSNSLWTDQDRDASVRVANLLRDVLRVVHDALLEYVTRPGVELGLSPYESLDALAQAMTDSVMVDESVTSEEVGKHQRGSTADIGANALLGVGASIRGSLKTEKSVEKVSRILREGRPLERILFQSLEQSLVAAIDGAGLDRVHLLLDEWTAVPVELQPLLAEFIKRVCFPNPRITTKIAALEYRSLFSVALGRNNLLGFELGADISTSLELDDYFVFDRDNEGTLVLFSELLFRHVSTDCESHWFAEKMKKEFSTAPTINEIRRTLERVGWSNRYLTKEYGIKAPSEFIAAMFDNDTTFRELVRAGEGVARDFMAIFRAAFFDALRRRKDQIDRSAVRKAARDWFQQDKAPNLDGQQEAVLEKIVNFVVGGKNARSFLFAGDAESHDVIEALFDNRVIHLVQRGYIDDLARPGMKFNVYTLDFGTYVQLLGTPAAPKGDFTRNLVDPDGVVVPFHDERAIRRIVLPTNLLVAKLT